MTEPDPTSGGAAQRQGPLRGIRVLDLTAVLMGPYCTQILADMGADVIKVESPEGDTTRRLPGGIKPGMPGMFLNANRGKRSLVLDLKQPAGRAALLRLAETADVFIHSMRSDAMARLALGYADVAAVNPEIVYANLYGYSRRGPYAGFPAYDDTIQGVSGMAMLQGLMTGTPGYVATVMADKVTGLTAAYAVMMALFHRERSGEGQEVEIAMFETLASFLMIEHIGGALFDPPVGEPVYSRVVTPERRPYKTADGYISVLIYSDKQWGRFVELAGNPPWTADPRFQRLEGRAAHIAEVYALVGQCLETRASAEWLAGFQAAGIPAMPLNTTADLMTDPHLRAVGFFASVPTKEGRLRFPAIPTWFSKSPGRITEAGPGLGEHSAEILGEAGFSEAEIAALVGLGGDGEEA
jgi:crotonobetainyl-CoA:carnitine CoA-transferase CaiB-like acyl-CoA transferase